MKHISRPSIVFSQAQSQPLEAKLPSNYHEQIIRPDEYDFVVPRIYPNMKIPARVQISRKIKQYNAFNLNEHLGGIDWGEGELSLINYVFAKNYVYEYGCSDSNIKANKVKGRAFNPEKKQYEKFIITNKQHSPKLASNDDQHIKNWFAGKFMSTKSKQNSASKTQYIIHRSQICFDFEDPTVYVHEVLNGIKRRKKIVQRLQYEFYVDSMDLQGAPLPSDRLIQSVKKFVKGNGLYDISITYADIMHFANHYRRTMNEILFRKKVQDECLPIKMPRKHRQIKPSYYPSALKKQIKFIKDNKIIKLVPKSIKKRTKDFDTRSLFLNQIIPQILLELKTKLNGPFNAIRLFKQLKDCVVDKFYVQQERSIYNCYSALNQFIITPISSKIRNELIQNSDGWFRLYDTNKNLYMDSKLKRMMILIVNMIRDSIRQKLFQEVEIFYEFFKKNLPESILIDSITQSSAFYRGKDLMKNIMVIEIVINQGKLCLSHFSKKLLQGLKKMIRRPFQLFATIPSPENKILKEIFGSSKFQQGIKIQSPQYIGYQESTNNQKDNQTNTRIAEDNKSQQIGKRIKQFDSLFEALIEPLTQYQSLIDNVCEEMNLEGIMNNRGVNFDNASDIVEAFNNLNYVEQKFREIFNKNQVKLGFFHIDYTLVRSQVFDHFSNTRQSYRRQLLAIKARYTTIFNNRINSLLRQLSKKPENVYELLTKHKKVNNLNDVLKQQLKIGDIRQLNAICEQFGCRMNMLEMKMQCQNQKIVSKIYGSRQTIEKQFNEMKKNQLGNIQKQKQDINESFKMIQITLGSFSQQTQVEKYGQYTEKIRYMRNIFEKLKKDHKQLANKKQILEIDIDTNYLQEMFDEFEKNIVPYELLWVSVEKWITISQVWLHQSIGSFKLSDPQNLLKNLTNNLKKAVKHFLLSGDDNIRIIADKFKKQIQEFQPSLQLLKIIKKQGFTKRHLQEIGIILKKQINYLTLHQAIQLGFLQKLQQLQTISNDAWNQFSLEQTLSRVTREISLLKFIIDHYLDKKSNQILMITNLRSLTTQTDSILANLQSVQFNPMKGMYENDIKQLYEKSLYISNSIKICQDFQQIFIELHPIFDSTDIVKQMPSQNKKFAKVLRVWLQLLQYIKNIRSVNDACSSQNIYEKVKTILTSIEKIKKSLISYLQQKRKGFNRFYLLSNSEMFELFAMSSNIEKINALIPKLFDSITHLIIDNDNYKIRGFSSQNLCQVQLNSFIDYKNINTEIWLTSLDKEIKKTILSTILKYLVVNQSENLGLSMTASIVMKKSKVMKVPEKAKLNIEDSGYWLDLIKQQKTIPQVVYTLFEIQFTKFLEDKIKGSLQDLIKKYKQILQTLVNHKKKSLTTKLNTVHETILCSLIILTISKIQIGRFLYEGKIQKTDNFQYKKILKYSYYDQSILDDDDYREDWGVGNGQKIKVKIMDIENQYGYHYLGNYSRLVVTNVSDRMMLVYMLAGKYSLGGAAIGPAGTGKSQTTKEIAKINGKTCIVYNCSQDFETDTLFRLMKALGVTGLWMCFDQFNRLKRELFSVLAEQLSLLHRYRSFRHKMQANFLGDLLLIQPSFQLCVTYNPTYQGRQTIPHNIHQLFRNVAMIKPDQLTICISLLFSSGYSKGKQIAEKIIKVFIISRKIWEKEQLYDFSLRALKSVVDLSNKILVQNHDLQQNAILSALTILNLPKMHSDDRQQFQKIIKAEFPNYISTPSLSIASQRLKDFQEIITVRDGILLCGQSLSGKQITIDQFKKLYGNKKWSFETIYHDILSVEELYGKLDPTTKLWSDGIFTRFLRKGIIQLIQDRQKYLMVIFNGSIYSEWVENLNSVLDMTRKLSLSSGQIINIPQNFKILISCTELGRATPATVSRSGVIIYDHTSCKDLCKGLNGNFPLKILNFFQELIDQLKQEYVYKIEPRFLLFWVISLYQQSIPINYDTFIYFLSQIMEGILTKAGQQIYERICRSYMTIPQSSFKVLLNNQNQLIPLDSEFKKFRAYEKINEEQEEVDEDKSLCYEQVFISTPKYLKLKQLFRHFFTHSINKLFLVIGPPNIGKTCYTLAYLNTLPKSKNFKYKIYLTKRSTSKQMFDSMKDMFMKKSSVKLGTIPGFKINIFIEDFNMPLKNKFQVTENQQLFRMIFSKGSWYNYEHLNQQWIEDYLFMADSGLTKSSNKGFNIQTRIFRHIIPIFMNQTEKEQIKSIFTEIFSKFHSIQQKNVTDLLGKIVQFFFIAKQYSFSEIKDIKFSLMDVSRTVKGILSWDLAEHRNKIQKIVLFEISRNFFAKIIDNTIRKQLLEKLCEIYGIKVSELFLIHNLQNSIVAYSKCQQVTDIIDFTSKMQYICDQYKTVHRESRSIIVFPDMIQYLIKIYRTLATDTTHCVIVGLSKCGKKILVQLASYLISSELYEISEGQETKQWQQSIKSAIKNCYKSKNSGILSIEHRHIQKEERINDINILLSSMHLPKIYSEADIEQIVYMLQVDLVKKNLQINRSNTWAQLIRYLKQKLHIVLLLNPTYQSFTSHLLNYPAIIKNCTFFYIKPWPQEGLNLIGRLQMSDLGYNLDMLPKIHQFCAKIAQHKTSTLASIWQGLYFNFVTLLRQIYETNDDILKKSKSQYQKGLVIIGETEQQLKKTKDKIKKLQPAIIIMESQTAKTVKTLNIQKKNAHDTNEALIKKNAELQQIIQSSRKIKKVLEHKITIVNQQLTRAWDNVSLIKPSHISQIKALANPSEFIKTVLSALVILTYDGPLLKEVIERNGAQIVQQSYFQTAKKYVLSKDAKSICRTLMDFKRENVTKQMYTKLEQKCLSYKRWSEKQAKSANRAISYFFLWVQAVANQYKIYTQTQPLRDQLQEISTLLSDKQREIIHIKRQLQVFKQKIEQLEKNHAAKQQSLQDYRLQIAKFQKMLSRGYQLLKQIQQQKVKWVRYQQEIDNNLSTNFGDSVIMASSIIYLSPHVYELRNIIKKQIRKLCNEHGNKCKQGMPWIINREDSQIYHTFDITNNQFVIDNLKIIETSPQKIVLLLDPQQQGITYVKKLNWQKYHIPIDKISEYDANVSKTLQSAIIYGRIVLLQIDPSKFNQKLRFIIKPTLINNQIKYREKMIPLHQNFKLYLYATTFMNKNFSMELLAHTQVVNFKMTMQQLQERIMEIIIAVEIPLLKGRIQEIYRINIKDNQTLANIQDKILNLFSQEITAEQILESQEIIGTVVHSNRLYKQIQGRLAESNIQKQQIKKQKSQYETKVKNTCLLYENILRLKLVSSLYNYSYQWYIQLFEANIHNFEENLFKTVSKALKSQQKIVVAILIAEINHQNLPWNCLFNSSQIGNNKSSILNFLLSNSNDPQYSSNDMFQLVSNQLGQSIRQLPVSQQKWNKIILRVKKVLKYIPNLQNYLINKCQIFEPLVTVGYKNILEAVPDQFSGLDFFHRILLISCFRPESVLTLLKEWIQINLGDNFADFNPSPGTLVQNTKPFRPIIFIMDDPTMDSIESIRQIYKDFNKKDQISTPIVSMHWSPNQLEQLQTIIKSSISQDQWLVLQGATTQKAAQYIKKYFEQIIILPQKTFRLWIILNDASQFSNRFTQFCDKIRMIPKRNMRKRICESFYHHFNQIQKKETDLFEKNKKKLLISQLCTLHHILQQFNFYNRLLYHNKKKPVYTFTQWDLRLILEEILPYEVNNKLKEIIHEMICSLAYGSQMRTYQISKLLRVNSQIFIDGIITDRNTFWQTIWSDEKFPKQQAEYDHEVKTKINQARYLQIFGVNQRVTKVFETQNYDKICQFYEKTTFSSSENISETILGKLKVLEQQLYPFDFWKFSKDMELKLSDFDNFSLNKAFYFFFRKQFNYYCQKYHQIINDIDFHKNILKSNKNELFKKEIQQFMFDIFLERVPERWSGSKKPNTPLIYIYVLIQRMKALRQYIDNYSNNYYPIKCGIITNPSLLFNSFLQKHKLTRDSSLYYFLFVPITQTLLYTDDIKAYNKREQEYTPITKLSQIVEHSLAIMVLTQLYCWNFFIHYSGSNSISAPRGILTTKNKVLSNKNQINNQSEMKVSGILYVIDKKKVSEKMIANRCIAVQLYKYSIEDIAQENQPLMDLYIQYDESTDPAEIIQKNIHCSLAL